MPSYLDLGVIAIVLISAILAMLRGFTREVLAIASWVAAAAAGYYLRDYLTPYLKPYISKEPGLSIAAATIIFFVALIVVSIITVNLSDAILDSKVGALDRSLGFLFGVARGFLLCVIGYVFFSMLDPVDRQPVWMREAKTRPLLESVGKDITAMLPDMTALVPRDVMNKFSKPKPEDAGGTPSDKPDAGNPEPSAPDADSPVPLPPSRNGGGDNGGKEP
ncbi:Colicin V production protein [Beijerinckiaceae bacterium RH AL1]|jgi:membrane protein required for colicin V production|nr:CvpA family protein [Beijerinckiaceae bacterium]VVB45752.1 Colicin V production protein [Beijerinckiaceae bacterium RH CH11]VVB45828.1 Colicin V production protein [Beijerinckiaceae bacterium RH AL8]VVC55022.1 Colicin V production protein [Beijerinckiaceae bacterium RH AL1]